ncbi:MAG TPA: hypothetical protein VFC68_06420, partial [Treponemataceae bacterium]|nr:hypothetical protein [Treponemataceae bacterium]
MKNRRFSAFLIIFFLLNTVFAQTSNKSTATITSDSLFFTFDQLGLHPKKQLLSGSLSPDFPYNIIVPFKNNTNKFYENSLTILFSQSYSIQYINEFLNLFEYLQSNQIMHFDISFVFTANDQNATHSLSGTKTYANSIPKKNKTFVLCLDYNENHKKDTVLITPGGRTSTGKGSLCPRSVMDTTIETCYSANLPFSIQGRFLPLYRLGFFNMSPRLSHILEEEFPAIAITLNKENEQAIFSFLENLCAQSLEWDSTTSEIHYSVIKLPRHAVFFSERAYIVLLILSAAITLFLSFGLSFIKGAHSYIHRKEFAKSWPIIPIAVLITAIFLIPIQKITGIITATSYINPISFLLLETSFA